jgi:hypothetical protein
VDAELARLKGKVSGQELPAADAPEAIEAGPILDGVTEEAPVEKPNEQQQ